MPADDPDLATLTLECPHCARDVRQPLAWVQTHREFRCPHCDGLIKVADETIDKAIGEAVKGLGKLLGQ